MQGVGVLGGGGGPVKLRSLVRLLKCIAQPCRRGTATMTTMAMTTAMEDPEALNARPVYVHNV